ncbi:hypothetical protein [Rheinheimera sp.]|uniref:hypothetical protein n=1 Tax=Rheinheimera sp. TaxID=1869214 RepID=UPI00307EEE4E
MRTLRTISLMAAAALAVPAMAATEVNPKLGQNLSIMQDILKKSLGGEEHSVGRVSHSYLLGQGVAFKIDSSGGWFRHMLLAPTAPLAPLPPPAPGAAISAQAAKAVTVVSTGDGFSFNIDEEAIEEMAEAAEALAEQQRDQSDKLRDLRDQRRDLERELRDYERTKRDYEFQSKVGKLDSGQQKELNEANQKAQQVQSKLAELQKSLTAQEQEYQRKQAEQQKLAAQRQAELVAKMGGVFTTTLCDYGASLRELKDDEFVSLQLSLSSRSNSKDHYWLVRKADINQCVTGRINAADLLKKASYYQY